MCHTGGEICGDVGGDSVIRVDRSCNEDGDIRLCNEVGDCVVELWGLCSELWDCLIRVERMREMW